MFGIFKKETAPQSPLKADRRQLIEGSFQWLTNTFDKEAILHRRILTPHYSDFPIRYNGDPQTATETLDIIAIQMEIEPSELDLHFYDDTINQLSTGSPTGGKLTLATADDEPAGSNHPLWQGRNEAGRYDITSRISHLQRPEYLVAVMARDLAQIKLLGEARIPEPNQTLTDMTTLIFGLGIFNANASFTSQNISLPGLNTRMTQMEWGHALALFAHFRKEKNPAWTAHLVKNIKSDFQRSEQYIAYHQPK